MSTSNVDLSLSLFCRSWNFILNHAFNLPPHDNAANHRLAFTTSIIMATPTPLFRLLTPLLQSFHTTTTTPFALRNSVKATSQKPTSQRTFSSSPSHLARGRGKPKADPRITLIRYHLQHPQTPRPLRFSRLRALRHWTIHRAWMLARRKRMESEEGELQRFVSYFP